MLDDFKGIINLNKNEKKVEYLELIYDLIFVYVVGRNRSLMHHLEGGFIDPDIFLLRCPVSGNPPR